MYMLALQLVLRIVKLPTNMLYSNKVVHLARTLGVHYGLKKLPVWHSCQDHYCGGEEAWSPSMGFLWTIQQQHKVTEQLYSM